MDLGLEATSTRSTTPRRSSLVHRRSEATHAAADSPLVEGEHAELVRNAPRRAGEAGDSAAAGFTILAMLV
jgi:hypothetical protein